MSFKDAVSDKNKKSKVAPDAIDDTESKGYQNDEATRLFADIGEDTGDIPLQGSAETEDEKPDNTKVDVDIDEVIDEVSSKDDADPDEDQAEESDDEAGSQETVGAEEGDKVDNGKKTDKDQSELIATLQEENRMLKEKLNSMGSVKNVMAALGIQDLSQNQVVQVMQDLKLVSNYASNPKFLDVMEKVAKGDFTVADEKPKTVLDFLPEGEDEYDHVDAMSDHTSASWKARIKWEAYNESQKAERQALLSEINTFKKNAGKPAAGDNGIMDKIQKSQAALSAKLKHIKAFALNEYGTTEGHAVYEKFLKDFKAMDEEIFRVAVAVVAKREGVKSVKQRKIEENGNGMSTEAGARGGIEDSAGKKGRPQYENPEEIQKRMKSVFSDWDAPLDQIY